MIAVKKLNGEIELTNSMIERVKMTCAGSPFLCLLYPRSAKEKQAHLERVASDYLKSKNGGNRK